MLVLELSASTPKAAIGTIDVPVSASIDEVTEAVAQLIQDEERDFQRHVVDDLIHAHEVGTAVTGLQPTIDAVSAGRAMLVVVDAAFGKRAQVQALFRLALETGCRIQVIRSDPALHLAGSIGAQLRPS